MTESLIQIGTTPDGDPIYRKRGPADDRLDAMKASTADWLTTSWAPTPELTRSGKVNKHAVAPDTMNRLRSTLTASEAQQLEAEAIDPVEARLIRIEAMLKLLVAKHG